MNGYVWQYVHTGYTDKLIIFVRLNYKMSEYYLKITIRRCETKLLNPNRPASTEQ